MPARTAALRASTSDALRVRVYRLIENLTVREAEQLRLFFSRAERPEQIWDDCDRVDWMLAFQSAQLRADTPRAHPLARALRAFACWCARDAATDLSKVRFETLAVAERVAAGKAPEAELILVRSRHAAGAGAAGVVGLPRCIPAAAAQLAAFDATNPDPLNAARGASHYAVRAAQFRLADAQAADERTRTRTGGRAQTHPAADFLWRHPALETAVELRERARQADVLRFWVPNPFGG